ncbi:hypothetical protein E0Z10_g4616 [Xylaria hypoxylon]|uniref:Uncharacterized protein n=1 Tax=Xylaria hypoxylon TaxID=37992 RepID=A0A4Z0YKP6_9PEZI|nr:hypothetical protein E0Z10_g4616 [Xylaria hypoxylon]
MASMINIDAPGAYPETPLNEDPIQQTQPSGHNFTDSRNPVGEPSLARGADPISSRQTPLQSTQFNQETPRSLGNDNAHFSGHHSKDSGIHADDSSYGRGGQSDGNNSKPGLMTGAFSRVGGRESAFTQNANYTHDSPSTTQSTRGDALPRYDDVEPPNAPTNRFTAVNTTANTQNMDSDNNSTPPDTTGYASSTAPNATGYADQDRNKVQGGLRGKSQTKHSEPYWGSIPFGAGVYNGVTGHGSNEATTHQKSFNDADNTTTASSSVYSGVTGHGSEPIPQQSSFDNTHSDTTSNTGIYNGVTGHGSEHSANNPRASEYDQDITTNDPATRQRGFPLANDANTTAPAKVNDPETRNKDSHFKENFAGAGAATTGGYAANKYLNRDNEREAQPAAEKSRDEKSHDADQTKSHSIFNLRSHKDKHAAPVANRTENRTLEQQPLDRESENQGKDDSKLGYYSAIGAATGAGVYGMGKYATRESDREQVPENEMAPSTTSHDAMRESTLNDLAAAGAHGLRKHPKRDNINEQLSEPVNENMSRNMHDSTRTEPQIASFDRSNETTSREQSQYNIGDNLTEHNDRAIHSHHRQYNDNMPSGNSTSGTQNAERSSTDSSHGGQYNVLSSGTPSGISLEHAHNSGNRS